MARESWGLFARSVLSACTLGAPRWGGRGREGEGELPPVNCVRERRGSVWAWGEAQPAGAPAWYWTPQRSATCGGEISRRVGAPLLPGTCPSPPAV